MFISDIHGPFHVGHEPVRGREGRRRRYGAIVEELAWACRYFFCRKCVQAHVDADLGASGPGQLSSRVQYSVVSEALAAREPSPLAMVVLCSLRRGETCAGG